MRYLILEDPKLLKIGMRVKCCLDCSEVIDRSDDGDSDNPDDLGWFTGKIVNLKKDGNEYILEINRDDSSPSDRWTVNLDESLMDYIQIEMPDLWDK